MKVLIRRRARLKDLGRCANMQCRSILEPPYNVLEFTLNCEPGHAFSRAFCVECIQAIQANDYRDAEFVIQERGHEAC